MDPATPDPLRLGNHLRRVMCCQITPQLFAGVDPSGAEALAGRAGLQHNWAARLE